MYLENLKIQLKNTLDHITIGINVPAISGHNIVNNLDLERFFD